jgi:hypothetical protein
MSDDNPLETISDMQDTIDYMTELDVFIDDKEFMEVMDLAVKIIAKPNSDPAKVANVCVKLEAYALLFRSKFVAYMSFKKGEKNGSMKKNFYKEMYTGIDKLVDALKYQMR